MLLLELNVGSVFYAIMVGIFASSLQIAQQSHMHYKKLLTQTKQYMAQAKLPFPLRSQVRDYSHATTNMP